MLQPHDNNKTRKIFIMTQNIFCGIDFGTSNSSIATASKEKAPELINVESLYTTIPSTIFYEDGKSSPIFGRISATVVSAMYLAISTP